MPEAVAKAEADKAAATKRDKRGKRGGKRVKAAKAAEAAEADKAGHVTLRKLSIPLAGTSNLS